MRPPIRSKPWLIAVVLAFGLAFSASLTFEYAEGDDASTIAFHALGRNVDLQPPYSPYHSMMDTLLRLVPAQERLLRMTAISLSAASVLCMVLLSLTLAFEWLRPIPELSPLPSAVAVLFAIPELFYLGLVLTPSVIAMSLVLLAHRVARRANRNHPDLARLVLAAALFGAGAAFRWDTVVYGAIIAADLALLHNESGANRLHPRFGVAILWGVLALLAFFSAIVASGYRPEDVLRVAQFGVGFSASRPHFSTPALAALQTLLTPGFGLFTLIGLCILWQRIPRLFILVVLGVLLVIPWMVTGVPKYLLVALPGLVSAFILGFSQAWAVSKGRPLARLSIVLCLGIPWMVGIRVARQESSWGPGFELRPFTSHMTSGWEPTLGPGAAAPTPEGPRPAFGHLYVLLGGWRHLLHDFSEERSQYVQTAAETGLPILRLRGSNGLDTMALVAHGFVTHDSASRRSSRVSLLLERRFQDPRGIRVTYLRAEQPDLLKPGLLQDLSQAYGSRVILLSYPSDMRHLYECAPGALEPLGPMSSLLELAKLRHSRC
jgi:hypothetical protein